MTDGFRMMGAGLWETTYCHVFITNSLHLWVQKQPFETEEMIYVPLALINLTGAIQDFLWENIKLLTIYH